MRRTSGGGLRRRMREIEQFQRRLPQLAYRDFVANTPIDTGNARRSTDLRGNEIQANYDYSVRLEKQGWSRQAPNGMSEPTINRIRELLRGLN